MSVSLLPIGPASYRPGRTYVSYPTEIGTVYVNTRKTTPGFTDVCVAKGDPGERRATADLIIDEYPGAYWCPKLDGDGKIKEYRVRVPHPVQ